MAVAAYPGTFDPPTVAHLAIAEAALDQLGVERVDLVLSRRPLGKRHRDLVLLEDRLSVLEQVTSRRAGLGVVVTESELLVDVAAGYDALVLGADKWVQINDASWYGGSIAARDAAIAGLPPVAIAPRPPHPLPSSLPVLRLDPAHLEVSSSVVRRGRTEWMLEEAAAFDRRTGAWSDPARYRRRRVERRAGGRGR